MNDAEEYSKKIEEWNAKKVGVKEFIDSLNTDKIENIKQVITEINELIDERKELSLSLINTYEHILIKNSDMMNRISPEFVKELISLHQETIRIEEAKVKEKLECWRDIALLKRELRERLRDFREQEKKNIAFSNLMED
ncbi:MAG: hypothetical protein ACLFPQ_05840 [Candidatus Woesearchaeota archaeon]